MVDGASLEKKAGLPPRGASPFRSAAIALRGGILPISLASEGEFQIRSGRLAFGKNPWGPSGHHSHHERRTRSCLKGSRTPRTISS